MIVQANTVGAAAKVIPMHDHLTLVGQLGRGFGNDLFSPLVPRELMEYAIANHDAGWGTVDASLGIDPDTDLPPNLLRTPLEELVKTGPGSASFNQKHHPYCGLIVSMHACGLLNGRYGFSDKIVLDVLPKDVAPLFEEMLTSEARRQEHLKEILSQDPTSQAWIEEETLWANYKALQFFDTLGLYFCMEDAALRGVSSFEHVPKTATEDVTITVTPRGNGVYEVDPYPFSCDAYQVLLPGTVVHPSKDVRTAEHALRNGAFSPETITLVSKEMALS